MFDFTRSSINGNYLNHYEDDNICLGFTEKNFRLSDLTTMFTISGILELKQIHSDIIRLSNDVEPGLEGDGIILTEPNIMAVIKTADCIPLFFWDNNYLLGGIIHVGWQGLLKGIEKKLLGLIDALSISKENLSFFLGPSIEKNCYEVGPDLFDRFSANNYRDIIFYPHQIKNKIKYLMDLKKGLTLALREFGIEESRIKSSKVCNFCEKKRFPSYRREKNTNNRIYNFFYLKN